MNKHHHKPKRYRYKDCWVEIFLDGDSQCDRILYSASIELPNNKGVIDTESYPIREEAELAAAQLIDSINYATPPRG